MRPSTPLTALVSERLGLVSGVEDQRDAEQRGRVLAPPESQNGMGRALAVFLTGIWLVFLYDAFRLAWQHRDSASGDVALLALAAFVVVYLAQFAHLRSTVWGRRRQAGGRWYHSRAGLLQWALLGVLSAVSTATIGQEGASTWVFFVVCGLWTFRLPVGLAIGGVLVVVYEFLTVHIESWSHDSGILMSMLFAMAAVAGMMVAAQRQRALAEAREENARLAIQEERNRMARDVHDILGHSLTVITVKAELAARLLEVNPERAKTEVEDLERLARDALADVRQAVAGFRDLSLPGELARARTSLAAAGIEANLPNATDEVPTRLRELCAWAVREGVTNVIRHSGASACTVTLTNRGITIADDGVGPAPGPPGTGLLGLEERALAVGATLRTRRLEPRGFELSVLVNDSSDPAASRPSPSDRVDA